MVSTGVDVTGDQMHDLGRSHDSSEEKGHGLGSGDTEIVSVPSTSSHHVQRKLKERHIQLIGP